MPALFDIKCHLPRNMTLSGSCVLNKWLRVSRLLSRIKLMTQRSKQDRVPG